METSKKTTSLTLNKKTIARYAASPRPDKESFIDTTLLTISTIWKPGKA